MSNIKARTNGAGSILSSSWNLGSHHKNGGAYRDRTDDLKLAKLALSQLS